MAKLRWNQHPIEDDIGYSGPLSYRHFKVIGWVLLILHMVVPIMKLGMNFDPYLAEMLAIPASVLEFFTPLSVFFLLIASMSQLITKGDYTKQMLINGGATLAIILVFELIYHRYIVGSVDAFVGNRLTSLSLINAVFSAVNPVGFMTFNVFLDLFLCTTVMFFLNYKPKRIFVGEQLKWFRCLVILPIVYEFLCLWLKLMANSGDFHMPLSLFPFLTAKPPMMLFVFCAMVVYQATRERRFCAGGRTHEEYQAYLGTNRDCWQFARFSAIICLIAGLLDLIIAGVAIIGEVGANYTALSAIPEDEMSLFVDRLITKYVNAGFGGSADLLFFVPVMLLYNYRKTYKHTTIELAIPIVSIVALLFIYLEAGLVAMGTLAAIVKDEVMPQISEMLASIEATGSEATGDMSDEEIIALLEELFGSEADKEDTTKLPAGSPAQDAPQPEAPPQAGAAPAQEAPVESAVVSQQQTEPVAYQTTPAYAPRPQRQYVRQYYTEPAVDDEPEVEEAIAPIEIEQQQAPTTEASVPEQEITQTTEAPVDETQAQDAAAPLETEHDAQETAAPEQGTEQPLSPSVPEQQTEYAAPFETEPQDGNAVLPSFE